MATPTFSCEFKGKLRYQGDIQCHFQSVVERFIFLGQYDVTSEVPI